MEAHEKAQMVGAKRMKSIPEVLEEVEVLIDTHFFNDFSETKSSAFLKKVIAAHQSAIDLHLFGKTWRSLNCTLKTMEMIREVQENIICVWKEEGDDHKEECELEMLVQQVRTCAEREAHRELLQASAR